MGSQDESDVSYNTESEDNIKIPESLPEIPESDRSFVYYSGYLDTKTGRIEKIRLSKELQELTYKYCEAYGAPYEAVMAIMGVETGWNADIGVSKNGKYYGIGMLNIEYNEKPLKDMGITLQTPHGGIKGTCIVFASKYKEFGDIEKAMIAYNGGSSYARTLFSHGVTSTSYSRKAKSIMNALIVGEQ